MPHHDARPAAARRPLARCAAALALLALIALATACAALGPSLFDPAFERLFGAADPTRFDHPAAPPAGESYVQQVQPLLDRRCVVCHACYDAPCQFKATSWDGLVRGASQTPVYDASRLTAAPTTRLYVDAQQPSEWRARGFFAVVNERAPTAEAERLAGLMHRLLSLKQQHPGPAEGTWPAALDLSADRAQMCPAESQIGGYEQAQPLGGMPFGLPALSTAEHGVLARWLAQGAPYEGPPPLPAAVQALVAQWERFFNGDSAKERLFARYAYEHLFLAHLHFDDAPAAADALRYFKLVRSATPPGTPVREVTARRPVDDPGVPRVYYRLVPERESIVAKTHMPYALNAQRMARWRALFLDAPYKVDRLPGYDARTAANPFATFGALPVGARYRFMLDEAEFTIMGFIKGPVCRGQIALNVIEDRFWVTFLAPSAEYDTAVDAMLQHAGPLASLPSGRSDTAILGPWLRHARLENAYLQARTKFLTQRLHGTDRLNLDVLWNGEGRNRNAALTVFRHFDSASVVQGLVGDEPKTAWVIGYPLLERIHYLLVAGYDVYGNIGHQLNSRLYMDYLRAEGEFNFLTLLPQSQRLAVRNHWYRGAGEAAREQVYGGPATTLPVETGIRYATADAKGELLGLIKTRLAPVLDTRFDLSSHVPPALRAPLSALAALRGAALQWMPEHALLVVDLPDGSARTFSLLRDTGHASVSHLLGESRELLPEEDALTVVPGVLGAYPNAFYRVGASQLPALIEAIGALRSETDYTALSQRFAVRRTNPGFWAFSDALAERYRRDQPGEAGLLDYNRLENR